MIKGKMVDIYPDLAKITDDDKVLRYIMMVYDDNSPLIKGENNVNYRKEIAGRLAGFNEFKDSQFNGMVDCSDLEFVHSVVQYLILFQKPRLWVMIVSNEQMFIEYNQRLMQPIKSSEKEKDEMQSILIKSKLREELNFINKDLDVYYQQLFGIDKDLETKGKSKRITPENAML